ncbi:hypothetical protein [Streptomyces sp. NPDC054952]
MWAGNPGGTGGFGGRYALARIRSYQVTGPALRARHRYPTMPQVLTSGAPRQ